MKHYDLNGFDPELHGVNIEEPEYMPDCLVVSRNGYHVTVDFRNRKLGFGILKPDQSSICSSEKYERRGWRYRLLTDAANLAIWCSKSKHER